MSYIEKNLKNINRKKCLKIFFLVLILFQFPFFDILNASTTDIPPKYEVNGIVTDENGSPLIGVSIIEKGTQNGTVSDINGHFTLKCEKANPILVFSYVGYDKQEILIKEQSLLKIVMVESSKNLDEIVVIGYGSKRKGGLSAAVSTINNDQLIRTTSTTTAGALVGKVGGITWRQKSGTPGSFANLQIRNMGTPLYVIDGIIKDENFFNNLNVNDIENISILKDGSAAIYGVKAANGVILVTTKSGKISEKPQINLDCDFGWQAWTKYPQLLNAYQWVYANYMRDVNSANLGVSVDFAKQELEKWKTGYYNSETGEDYRGFDWKSAYVSNAAPQQNYNINISGGSEKNTYYVSFSHINQDAVFKDFNFHRSNLQSNFEMNPNKNLKINIQLGGNIKINENPALPGDDDYSLVKTSLFGMQPIYRPYANDNPLYLNYIVANDARNMAAFTKEYAGTFNQTERSSQNNLTLQYKLPLKGLTAKGTISYYYSDIDVNDNEKGWQEYSYDKTSNTYKLMYDKVASGQTYRVRKRLGTQDISGQLLLNYDNIFAKVHHVVALGGFEFYEKNYRNLNIMQNPVDNIFIDLLSTSENNTVNEINKTFSTASFIFRADYDYKQKYIFDFGARYDGSWKFPPEKRWGFFPSFSGAWVISGEDFFQNWSVSKWFTNLKLRVSYGEMGDDNIGSLYPDFAYLSGYTYNAAGSYISKDPLQNSESSMIIGSISKGIPITTLTWMKTSISDIGIDLGFFNNKLLAEFDAFKRYRDGIAATPNDIIFPLESGLTALPENLNSDENVGIDGYFKWNDKINKFNYFVGLNFTFARQKNVNRYGEIFYNALDKYYNSQSNRWANVSSGQVWMWDVIGRFKTQEEIDNYPVNIDGQNNTTLVPGDLIFKDVNGDGVINQQDKRPLGYASVDWPWDSSKGNKNPLLSMGLNLGFNWKGIDFAADFSAGFLNTFVPDWYMKWGTARTVNGYVYNTLNTWHHQDIFDPTSPWVAGKFPALRNSNPSTRDENNFYTRNVNYLRLRNLVVGYSLPEKISRKVGIQKTRVYFLGSNLFCWDTLSDYNIDPETSTVNGTDYPQTRVISIGLNLTF